MKSVKTNIIQKNLLFLFDAGFSFIAILAVLFDKDFFFLFFAVALTLYTLYKSYWKIDFDEEHFIYRTLFRKKADIKYNEFINTHTFSFKHKGVTIEYLIIHCGFRKIIVNKSSENFTEFENILNRQIKEAHHVRAISR